MTEIKSGMVAVLKTTDEPLFVLGIRAFTDYSDLGTDIVGTQGVKNTDMSGVSLGKIALVRRPQQTTNGIIHSVDLFFVEELESLDDKKARVLEEYMGFQAANKASVPNGANSSIPDLTFGN